MPMPRVEAGASALMVDYLTVGISALAMLADDPAIDVPVLAHLAFAGGLYGVAADGGEPAPAAGACSRGWPARTW